MKTIKSIALIKYVAVALLLSFSISCSNNGPETILTNNKFKYWDLYYDNPNVIYGGIEFYPDGYLQVYKYDRGNPQRYIMPTGDFVPVNNWSLHGKDTLVIGRAKYVISYLTDDSLAFYSVSDSQVYRLVASKDQSDH